MVETVIASSNRSEECHCDLDESLDEELEELDSAAKRQKFDSSKHLVAYVSKWEEEFNWLMPVTRILLEHDVCVYTGNCIIIIMQATKLYNIFVLVYQTCLIIELGKDPRGPSPVQLWGPTIPTPSASLRTLALKTPLYSIFLGTTLMNVCK